MKTHSCFRLLTNALTGAILFTTTALQAQAADQVKVTDLMTKDLVNVPGKEVTMITVDYPPDGADPVHRHNASAEKSWRNGKMRKLWLDRIVSQQSYAI
jgi:hypothetical protein